MHTHLRKISPALLLCLSAWTWAGTFTGRVVAVTDGDTIKVLGPGNVQERIRLAGIDAPEKRQPFGQASKQHLSDQVFDREVVVDWDKRDVYGRIVGKILVEDQDVDLEQVRAGLAWHYKQYAREQTPTDRASYAEAENDARTAHRGLWSEPDPTPPWEWRHPPKP